jgi:hypothetical protein
VDGITVNQLTDYLKQHWPAIREQLLNGTYRPKPVRRMEIPKPDGGVRKLGIRRNGSFSGLALAPVQKLSALSRQKLWSGLSIEYIDRWVLAQPTRTAVYGPVRTVVWQVVSRRRASVMLYER